MWRACRVAALRQLRREAARVPVARAPLALQQLGGVNSYFTNIAGVDREVLLTRSARDLRNELGDAQIGVVVKALKGELADATAREDVTSDEIVDLFMAAQKTRAISVMLDAFNFLDANYPAHINFAVYGEIFRILTRKNNAKRLIEIYETAKPRFKAVPEIIYRFGIVGYLQNGDMDTSIDIWQEMTDAGHETTNEITSRLMMAYARKGDAEKVMELYESVDPQIGYWHESCIDRIILSMGIIEHPAKAFEFYSNSSMKLSGGTLIALLSVCNSNNCKQQASDILANRKKFDLLLDARGYNRIMMTLEFLERNDEIKEILEEMVENNVRFDTRTNNIIERNAEYLKDTTFVADPNKSKAAGFTLSPRIREMLAQGNTKAAAELVDSIAKPVEKSQLPEDFEGEIPDDALIVSPSVARDAVRVYIKTNQHDKVAALVKGFSVVRGKYAYALAEKFDLLLDARGYNRIMMTLEFLERNDEIKEILEEMVENNVRFDTRTNNIIERNAEYLKDTTFVADPNKSKAAGFTLSPRIREMLAQGNTKAAAELVDSIAKPVEKSQLPEDFEGEIPDDALIVSPSVARDAVRVYIKTNQHDKVAALVKGFSVVRGKYAYALAEVITHYLKLRNKTGDELSYAASKAMLFQGVQIYRVDDTLKLFRRFHDPDAAVELFEQVLASYWGKDGRNVDMSVANADEDVGEYQPKPYFVNFNIGKVINLVLQTLVENGQVEKALDTLNMMESRDLDANQGNYVTILSSMRKHLRNNNANRKVKYDINNVQMVLQDLRSRNVKVNRAVVGFLCPAYVGANKQQRLELLEAFAEAQNDPNDSYILPHLCYETLLNFMAEEGNISEVRELYEEAVASLNEKETRGVPRGWVTIRISKLAKEGNIEEAEQITMQMPEECGGYTFRAVVSVLRGAIEAQKLETVDNMIALLEDRDFVVGLADAYELVHLAREKDLSLKVLDIIRLFEKGNLKEVAPAEEGKGNLEAAFVRRQHGDVHALRKVKTMYTVALKLCEKNGLWKQALILRDRMITLFGQEAMDEISSGQSNSTRKHRERKDKQSDDEE
ncbi:hypothetical protein PPTG_23620 [Phytophthora nicotianae INRA-310]|uniref:Pentacotripeptide-repeat region of PRORP domain-containing protein n=1 Tax=Phytophthora nicotianae (strain INRA-310) TaxID=761204 RepID=W2PU69_PHYN3|nr:hypothetical protein PPTG_23620 [Phytophthora nicotianae INRA-310]ETN04508.1 hypothetical protein PPTG_23620 [Phytophthora nicotianae INRA-310]